MAMIERIRKRRGLLMVFIGIGMLGFLVPYDAVMALFGVGNNRPIGEVNGVSISSQEYQVALQQRKSLVNYSNDESLKRAVWTDLLDQAILSDDYETLGLDITEDELDEILFGEYLSNFVKSTYYGGQAADDASKEQRRQYFESLGSKEYAGHQDMIKFKRRREKWDALVKQGLYANNLDAKYDYKFKSDKITFDFVAKPFTEIADSLVTVEDRDIKAYYNAHKEDDKYQQETEREIEYIEFKVEASDEDKGNLAEELTEIKAKWLTTDNDSAFCVRNGNTGKFFTLEYKNGDFEGPENELIANDSVGSLIGPYEHGNYVRVVRVLNRKAVPDSVECRHILFKADSPILMAGMKLKADSVKEEIVSGRTDFESMVTAFSDDPGSKDNGGKYEWFAKGRMVKEFEDACFWGEIGDLTIVQTTYGIHLIEVLGQKGGSEITKLAAIDRPIRPSESTMKNSFRDASDFSIVNNTADLFQNAADTMGLAIQTADKIKRNSNTIKGLNDVYPLVDWAFSSEVGDISEPKRSGDKFIIAHLTKTMEKGVPTYENVKDEMELEVIKEKKADMYKELMGSGNNLQEVAEAAGTTVKKANKIQLQRSNIPGAGSTEAEPEVIGLAFGISVGEMSSPIVGNAAVYVIAPSEEIELAEEKEIYVEEQDPLIKSSQNKFTQMFISMQKGADVEDSRYEY